MRISAALTATILFGLPVQADTVLVLPFSNASQTANLDWVGESVAETVREALAIHGVMVLARDDREEAYRRLSLRPDAILTRATVLKVGQALDADRIVYGEFYYTASPGGAGGGRGSLKIAARVIDLRHLTQSAEFSELGSLDDLASLQAHLAWQTLRALSPKAAPSEAEFGREWPQVRVDAIENYIRGLLATSPEQKLRLFSQAIRLEPKFSDAAYQLGLLAFARKDYRQAADWLHKVGERDVHFRKASFYLGIARFELGDYTGAQGAFERVAAEVPLNEVFNNLGAAQSRLGSAESVETLQKAMEGDSGDPVYHFNLGVALWKRGRLAEAADRFRAVLDRNPQDTEATMMLGRCLKNVAPKAAEIRQPLERLKTNYEEGAYWQLKALVQSEKP